MEKSSSDEYSSDKELFDKLVLGENIAFENFVHKMSNSQLIEFYDYVVKKSEDEIVDHNELYWYASIRLEELPTIKMYKNGQLYVNSTLMNMEEPSVLESDLTEAELMEINATVELLNRRKRDKHNQLKKLLKVFTGR